MRPTLTEVADRIESLMDNSNKEVAIKSVFEYLKEKGLHLDHEGDFLDSLLCERNFFSLEERLEFYIVEFMGDGNEDHNEGLALKDVA